MKRSLRALETLQATLSSTSDSTPGSRARSFLEERRLKGVVRERQLAKLSHYKRAEYVCLECVAELRDALRDIEELQYTLSGGTSAASSVSHRSPPRSFISREEREGAESPEGASDCDDERAQLLGGYSRPPTHRRQHPARRTGEAALLEQELLHARQRARRAHQQLQQLQREAARLAKSSPSVGGDPAGASVGATSGPGEGPASTAALESLDWQRAEKHVELARRWYRETFGVCVVSSVTSPAVTSYLQPDRLAQPQQSVGRTSYFGSGANPLPAGVVPTDGSASQGTSEVEGSGSRGAAERFSAAQNAESERGAFERKGDHSSSGGGGPWAPPSQALMLRSAREDAEFQEFFASVQVNDELMDATLGRLSEGLARLMDSARTIQDELATQEDLLQGTETRIHENEAQIANMNRRLRRAIRDVNDSSVCVYVMCLMVLLLILGVLLRMLD
ncbi:putative Qb-SNARE protein [Leptomonas seymouri]|uniref:Putative Qb-SNARE protein n=1 Tax=Leptomonas seymouri TaxID=5684 RepID=A0A0N0P557_LEPSE|nr:putative Qb-SNARE protein [Leptomonas seymouri]|eukprot:KPI85617.1 putative Qb-SNARE protein [Leptomonas seymouri]